MERVTWQRIAALVVCVGGLFMAMGTPMMAADVKVVDGFAAAMADAAAASRPLAVLVHGATWQGASRRLRDDVWQADAFREALNESFTLTEISVAQNAEEAAKKSFAEETKGWNSGTVRTFPAVQVFGPDGHLLQTLSGRELRDVAVSADALAAELTDLGKASHERDRLRAVIAAKAAQKADVSSLIDSLNQLELFPEKDAVKAFRQVDPADRSGWAAKLSFQGWEFIRSISGRIGKGEATAALSEVESMLINKHYDPPQRCLLLAAKGMALAALDRLEEAWQAYRLAYAWDPDGVNGKAVIRHAYRTVGSILRVAPSVELLVEGGASMSNLSRDGASVVVVPPDPQHDHASDHASLFSGPLKDFAFHSAEATGPAIMIDLKAPARIDMLQIVNRSAHQDRAVGLTVWLSDNAKDWRQVWQAEDVAPSWTVDLRSNSDRDALARYLKVGLPTEQQGILHLRAVNVFGSRPDDPPRPLSAMAIASSPDQLPINTAVNMQFDPSRINMRAIIAYAKSILDSGTGVASSPEMAEAATAVLKYDRPIVWRSTTNERVKGTATVITPATVTIEHDGQKTEVDRKRFSAGSLTVISTIESTVRKFFEIADTTDITRPPASGDPLPGDQDGR